MQKTVEKELKGTLKKLTGLVKANTEKLLSLSNEEWSSESGQKLVHETNYLATAEIYLRDSISSLRIARSRSLSVGKNASE